jgi:hypothetical protein
MVAADARTAVVFALSPGNAHDAPEGRALLEDLGLWEYDREFYKKRNEVERLFRRLKGFRRIFSRFEKLDVIFLAFINFVLIVEALR